MAGLPHVFILDWDGTIVGKVDYQSQRFNLAKTIRRYGFKVPNKPTNVPHAFTKDEQLVRPGFAAFVRSMREFYGGQCAFFIYTGSEKSWALQEIAWVERAHGIKFERPIFTRMDCILDASGNYRKSVKHIWPRILRALQSKHRIFTKAERDQILNSQTMIIDNNAVFMDFEQRLLICPDYGYMVFENLFDGFPKEVFRHPSVQQLVFSLVNDGMMCPHVRKTPTTAVASSKSDSTGVGLDTMMDMARRYEWFANKCRTISIMNRSYMNDVFWKYLRKLILKNNIQTLDTKLMQQLQSAVWKRQKSLQIAGNAASA